MYARMPLIRYDLACMSNEVAFLRDLIMDDV